MYPALPAERRCVSTTSEARRNSGSRKASRRDFAYVSAEGRHRRLRHSDGRRVSVSFHEGSDNFPIGTLRQLTGQAKWTQDDLRRLGLLRENRRLSPNSGKSVAFGERSCRG
ncbi:MAG: type II toxin-antitoxin system HicA family toxin [Terriglobia bacterium]